jgi:hypothetical protein
LVFLVMNDNRYIRNLIRMYQTSIAEEERIDREKLARKPKDWQDCKEYFKLWATYHFFLDREVGEFISYTARTKPALLSSYLLDLMRKKLDET